MRVEGYTPGTSIAYVRHPLGNSPPERALAKVAESGMFRVAILHIRNRHFGFG